MSETLPPVTVIIPARPDQAEVKAVTAGRQLDYPGDRLEIIVARGHHPSVQRNAALREARGEWIYFLDDDSTPPPGNLRRAAPLFSRPEAQMVGDRQAAAGTHAAIDLTVPETVQALIAARLDTLPPERKSLLQDAAVLGKVFWSEGVAAMGDRSTDEVEEGHTATTWPSVVNRTSRSRTGIPRAWASPRP